MNQKRGRPKGERGPLLNREWMSADLPDLAFCWSCNLKRHVVSFNPRTRRGLCGPCHGMIFFRQTPLLRSLSEKEREERRERLFKEAA
jgi:hypothetical protein